MLSIRSIVMAVACLTQLYVINGLAILDHQTFDIDDKELIFNDKSHKNGKFTYASCTINEESKERQCKVMREKTAYSNDFYTCDVKIKLENRKNDSDVNKDKLSIVPFAENKAIIQLVDNVKDGSMQFKTIDFDGCKVTTYEMSIIDPTDVGDRMILVPYKDSFDLFSLIHHVGNKYYITKFDADGKKLDLPLGATEPETYSSNVVRIIPISESRDKGTVYFEHINGSDSEFDVMIRKPNGTNVFLGKRTIYEHMASATNDDLIGICLKIYNTRPEFKCTQKDLNGEDKFNVSPLEKNNDTLVVTMRNLPGGGMLIAVATCVNPTFIYHQINFSVIKIDSTGKTVGTAHIGKTKAISESDDVNMSLSFHKDKDQNNCISIANYLSETSETKHHCAKCLSATDYCFTDADFTQ